MHGSMLLLSSALLFLLAAARGQEVCSSVVPMTTMYNGTVSMNCDARLNYRWWRSNDSCQSFVEHSSCSGSPNCIQPVNDSLERFYHFCCTDQSVMDGSQVATSMPMCFRIQICTDISDEVTPPVVLLGTTEKIYISLFGEPSPTDTPDLKLFNTNRVLVPNQPSILQRDFLYLDRTSELTFIYTFAMPDADDNLAVSDIVLEFSTQFSTPLEVCSGNRDTTIDILVRTGTTTTPVPTSTSVPPSSDTTPTAVPCRTVSGLAIGFIVFSVVVLVLLVVAVTVIVVVYWKLLQQRKSTSPSDPLRPPNLPISSRDQYRPLRQQSMTPGSAVHTPGTSFGQLPPLPTVAPSTTETVFTATVTTTLTTTATPPHYETIQNRSQDRSMGLEINPNAVDDTDPIQLAAISETDTVDTELMTVARNPEALYNGYDGELQNPGPTRNV